MKCYDAHTHRIPNHDSGIFQSDAIYTESPFSIGIHPWEAESGDIKSIEPLLSHPNCKAVGEIGLDRHKGPSIDLQKEVLFQQLNLANQLNKPVIFHIVRAWNEFFALYKTHKQTPWIIHGFNAPKQLNKVLEKDIYLSLGPASIQNPNLQIHLPTIPLNRILLETDDSGENIASVYQAYSEATGTSMERGCAQIEQNFIAIFGA
jgi:TatD DNase family protein